MAGHVLECCGGLPWGVSLEVGGGVGWRDTSRCRGGDCIFDDTGASTLDNTPRVICVTRIEGPALDLR